MIHRVVCVLTYLILVTLDFRYINLEIMERIVVVTIKIIKARRILWKNLITVL